MNRKNFLKTIGIGSVGLALNPVGLFSDEIEDTIRNKVTIRIEEKDGGSFEVGNESTISFLKDLSPEDDYLLVSFSGSSFFYKCDDIRRLVRTRDKLISAKNPWEKLVEILKNPSDNIFNVLLLKPSVDRLTIRIDNKALTMFAGSDRMQGSLFS